MASVRTIIPHAQDGAPIIDSFQCSHCEWSYVMQWQRAYTICYDDATRACRAFETHRCEDFKSGTTMTTE
jgi:hypothetical protein